MERNTEITKLVNVLLKTARVASQLGEQKEESAAHSAVQYNRVLTRLKELDPEIAAIFEPLPPNSSLSVVILACRQLAAYYEDESRFGGGWSKTCGVAFDTESFKEFWAKTAHDFEQFGETIRRSFDEWVKQKSPEQEKPKEKEQEG